MFQRKAEPKEKIEAVERYLCGESSLKCILEKYKIRRQTFYVWVRNYQVFGREGLRDKNTKRKYSAELKKEAVREYLSGKYSQEDICRKYKILSKAQLQRWIVKYNGHKELQPSRGRGRDIYMTKGRQTTYEKRVEIVSYCIECGNDYTAAIEKYGVSYQQIYSWVRKYQEKGAEGLQDMEGFWGILKCEMYYLNHFDTYEELKAAIESFIHYYNTRRRQHKLNCLPPASYRSLVEAA